MALTLGTDAEYLRVIVQKGLGWWAVLENADGAFPDGVSAALEFLAGDGSVVTEWPAVTDGATMTFTIPPGETAARREGERVRLVYRAPGLPAVVWAAGEVTVHGD